MSEHKAVSDAKERIAELVGKNDVVLFMKGTALFPQCGFSSRAIAILDHLGVPHSQATRWQGTPENASDLARVNE